MHGNFEKMHRQQGLCTLGKRACDALHDFLLVHYYRSTVQYRAVLQAKNYPRLDFALDFVQGWR